MYPEDLLTLPQTFLPTGLENLHTILRSTSAQFELRIDLEDWDNNTRYAVYENFYITHETDGYRLHIGNYSGRFASHTDVKTIFLGLCECQSSKTLIMRQTTVGNLFQGV